LAGDGARGGGAGGIVWANREKPVWHRGGARRRKGMRGGISNALHTLL